MAQQSKPKARGQQNKRKVEDDFDNGPNEATGKNRKANKKKKQRLDVSDDTPRAFTRLIQRAQAVKRTDKPAANNNNSWSKGSQVIESSSNNLTKKGRKGGSGSGNTDHGGNEQQQQQQQSQAPLVPLPGERLADFNRRVNAAIPVTQKDARKSKKMRKAEEQLLQKSKTEEVEEDDSDLSDDYDFDDEGDPLPPNQRPHKKKRNANNNSGSNRKRDRTKKRSNNNNRRSASPFAELENERPKLQSVGFGDFVTAPPSMLAKPKAKLYSIVDSVPKSAGSLAKREAIAEDRLAVIARYRAMMSEKEGRHRV